MISFVGIGIVFACVLGGFIIEGGHPMALFIPAEFLIIFGSAIGAMLIANPISAVKDLVGQLAGIAKGGRTKQDYLQMLIMMYELMTVSRKEGLVALEAHIEKPAGSAILKKYPSFLSNHHAVEFMTDTVRLIISGAEMASHELEALLDADIETHHHHSAQPSKILQWMADSLPGLGIVAAVLGIVLTMEAVDGPPAEIGHKVGAALVGTFMGVLLAYGFVGPLATKLGSKAEEDTTYLKVLKQVLLAFQRGTIPTIAVEFARRSMPGEIRPDFAELDKACRGKGK